MIGRCSIVFAVVVAISRESPALCLEEEGWVHTYRQMDAETDSGYWAHELIISRPRQIACPPRTTGFVECVQPPEYTCINTIPCVVNWLMAPIWLECHKFLPTDPLVFGSNCKVVRWDWTCRP